MVAHLATMAAAETLALHHGLKKCAVAIERTAKAGNRRVPGRGRARLPGGWNWPIAPRLIG
ncbi:hypothetical protein ACFS07_10445 [Undibacterium arcticum]